MQYKTYTLLIEKEVHHLICEARYLMYCTYENQYLTHETLFLNHDAYCLLSNARCPLSSIWDILLHDAYYIMCERHYLTHDAYYLMHDAYYLMCERHFLTHDAYYIRRHKKCWVNKKTRKHVRFIFKFYSEKNRRHVLYMSFG